MMKTLVVREYGRAVQVSKSLFKDEPLPADASPASYIGVSEQMAAVLDLLSADFEKAKAQYFPNWDDSTYSIQEGPESFGLSLIREDGEEVDDYVWRAWTAWYYWDEYDEDSPEIQPTFIYPEGYTTKKIYYRNFSWYTQAPTEED